MMYAGEARDQDPFPMQEDNTNVMHSGSGDRDYKEELPTIQNHDDEDELRDAVVVIFANKQDLLNAMVADEIGVKLGLCSLRQRHCFIRPTCATSGLYEGLELLSESIANKVDPSCCFIAAKMSLILNCAVKLSNLSIY
ncbi:unnamed protein product [Prunus brigantina]